MRKVKGTGIRNKVSRRLTVKRAVVGEAIYRLRDPGQLSTLVVAPRNCPNPKGAEIVILRNMTILRRVIAIETHGCYGAPTVVVKALLEELDYTVQDRGIAEPSCRRYLKARTFEFFWVSEFNPNQ